MASIIIPILQNYSTILRRALNGFCESRKFRKWCRKILQLKLRMNLPRCMENNENLVIWTGLRARRLGNGVGKFYTPPNSSVESFYFSISYERGPQFARLSVA